MLGMPNNLTEQALSHQAIVAFEVSSQSRQHVILKLLQFVLASTAVLRVLRISELYRRQLPLV